MFIPPFRMMISAPSGAGKSTLLVNLFKTNKMKGGLKGMFDPDNVFIFNPTYGLDKKFLEIPHEHENVWKEFDPVIMDDIFKDATALKLRDESILPHSLIIFEDCASENIFQNNKIFQHLAFRSRHVNISVIILTQKYVSVSTSIRRNMNYIILLAPYNYQELDAIIDENTDKKNKPALRNLLLSVFESGVYNNVLITYNKGAERYRKNILLPDSSILKLKDFIV